MLVLTNTPEFSEVAERAFSPGAERCCRNPAKLNLNAGTRRERRRIDLACLTLLSTDAIDPLARVGPRTSACDRANVPLVNPIAERRC